ncbi:MAG: glycosyl transferase [Acidobacteriota bacterium]
MSDFYQHGSGIGTLPRLCPDWTRAVEQPLRQAAPRLPKVALVLPALFSEFRTPAMPRILRALEDADYIHRVILSLDRAEPAEYRHARDRLASLPMKTSILWHDGPGLAAAREHLAAGGLRMPGPGKGRGVWFSLGLALGDPEVDVVAVHDCDIVNYSREMLARLLMPLLRPSFGYRFSKGYYSRFDDRLLYGRVTRLFFMPMISALVEVLGPSGLLTFLGAFRYPLSGEFAADRSLVRRLRVAPHWGLETSMLADLHQLLQHDEICQVELAENYRHKHQPNGGSDGSSGLSRMCREIAVSLFAALERDGMRLGGAFLNSLCASYRKHARSRLRPYRATAMINGMSYDQSREERTIDSFAHSLERAWELPRESGRAALPSWGALEARFPDFGERLGDWVFHQDASRPLALAAGENSAMSTGLLF